MDTIFTKIRKGEIPSVKLYSDDICFVILDINPIKKGHSLVIANEPYKNIEEVPEDVLKHMICIAKTIEAKLTKTLNCDGSNIIINNNPASGQEVPHIHIHVIPRYNNDNQKFGFEHEKYEDEEMAKYGKMLSL